MPLSALFFLMMGVGGWLVYDAVTGKHPWEDFTTTVKGPPGPPPNSVVTPAFESPANVAAHATGSPAGGGTGAIRGG